MSVNPIQVQKYLQGVNYPAGRDDLVRAARANGADDAVLDELKKIPDRTYNGPNAVSHELSQ
ncbi:DUF2795 domain-containing protein [Nocardia sp. BMG51109]|uniref:DUF2795 domain-containing protein n=1 Tax=Nocardia sp. BMG51109 TaxID=1056816 RepID=UPI0004634676|nr:DUF2795 domain-containing protein [Nocardia sp. BMG51109]